VARCEAELPERSIYRLLHRERDRLFPDELLADPYVQHGRRSVPPSILAVVMVLQRLEGCGDREAVDRFAHDLRLRYAAGVEDQMPGFVHTVLVELRARWGRGVQAAGAARLPAGVPDAHGLGRDAELTGDLGLWTPAANNSAARSRRAWSRSRSCWAAGRRGIVGIPPILTRRATGHQLEWTNNRGPGHAGS
jgi:Transposase domain (DUF772)